MKRNRGLAIAAAIAGVALAARADSSSSSASGGGWIRSRGTTGGKATFGLHAAFKADGTTPEGHVVFNDPGYPFSMVSTTITYLSINCNRAQIRGLFTHGDEVAGFNMNVTDNSGTGTPDQVNGIEAYSFVDESVSFYEGRDDLQAGNIRVQGPCTP